MKNVRAKTVHTSTLLLAMALVFWLSDGHTDDEEAERIVILRRIVAVRGGDTKKGRQDGPVSAVEETLTWQLAIAPIPWTLGFSYQRR